VTQDQNGRPTVVLGVIVAPGLAHELTERISTDLAEDLARTYGTVEWRTEFAVDRLVEPPVPTMEIFEAARRRLLDASWDVAVVVTDLPLHRGRRPVSLRVSPTHGVALVSLPALGAFHLGHRLRRTLLNLVGDLVGEGDSEYERRALRELATEAAEAPAGLRFLYIPALLFSHLRLLVGMVRANQPWRLASRLYGALVAALAVAAIGVITSDVWRISIAMGPWRLVLATVLSIVVTTLLIVAVHGLWERTLDPRVRDQVALFNIATTATVAIGILSLYGALFVLVLGSAALVITGEVFEHALARSVQPSDWAQLAWFVTSFATIGGALGALLESDEVVRQAAYASAAGELEPAEEPPPRDAGVRAG
jgi:membrane protein DedA with SNARE-associated domain